MNLALSFSAVAFLVGVAAGFWIATHIHSLVSAATRAVTVPSGDVDLLHAKVDNLTDHVAALGADVSEHIADTRDAITIVHETIAQAAQKTKADVIKTIGDAQRAGVSR